MRAYDSSKDPPGCGACSMMSPANVMRASAGSFDAPCGAGDAAGVTGCVRAARSEGDAGVTFAASTNTTGELGGRESSGSSAAIVAAMAAVITRFTAPSIAVRSAIAQPAAQPVDGEPRVHEHGIELRARLASRIDERRNAQPVRIPHEKVGARARQQCRNAL